MRMMVIAACTVLATAAAQEKEFHGRVVDAEGRPVAGVPVDTYWAVVDGKLSPRAGTRTDTEGGFAIRVNCQARRPNPLMAVDKTVAFGAALALDPDHPEVEVMLQLVPMVPVRGEITSKDLGAPIAGCFVSIFHPKAIIALVGVSCSGKFSLQLPPGDYRLSYSAADCVAANNKTATVAADAKDVDLGTTDLVPTVLSQLCGKTPPEWTVSDARGVDKTVKLADYKGKWVLLEFWGLW
jgi:hypothetical protein